MSSTMSKGNKVKRRLLDELEAGPLTANPKRFKNIDGQSKQNKEQMTTNVRNLPENGKKSKLLVNKVNPKGVKRRNNIARIIAKAGKAVQVQNDDGNNNAIPSNVNGRSSFKLGSKVVPIIKTRGMKAKELESKQRSVSQERNT